MLMSWMHFYWEDMVENYNPSTPHYWTGKNSECFNRDSGVVDKQLQLDQALAHHYTKQREHKFLTIILICILKIPVKEYF